MLVWEDSYKIGHDEMDAQHLILVALLNQLDINIDDDGARGTLPDVMAAVASYIAFHFAHEEAVMNAASYPRLDEHVAMHRRFTVELDRLRQLAASGEALKAALKVRSFVINWLIGHILESDVDYVQHIAATAR